MKYGTISGKVISVSSDVVTDNDSNVLFKVGIKLKDINMVMDKSQRLGLNMIL